MYNPLANLQNLMSRQAYAASSVKVHAMVNWYELSAFLLILPSMFISFVGFALVAANIVIAQEIGRNQRLIPALLIPFVNVLFVPTAVFIRWKLRWYEDSFFLVVFPIPVILILMGYGALICQIRKQRDAET